MWSSIQLKSTALESESSTIRFIDPNHISLLEKSLYYKCQYMNKINKKGKLICIFFQNTTASDNDGTGFNLVLFISRYFSLKAKGIIWLSSSIIAARPTALETNFHFRALQRGPEKIKYFELLAQLLEKLKKFSLVENPCLELWNLKNHTENVTKK